MREQVAPAGTEQVNFLAHIVFQFVKSGFGCTYLSLYLKKTKKISVILMLGGGPLFSKVRKGSPFKLAWTRNKLDDATHSTIIISQCVNSRRIREAVANWSKCNIPASGRGTNGNCPWCLQIIGGLIPPELCHIQIAC